MCDGVFGSDLGTIVIVVVVVAVVVAVVVVVVAVAVGQTTRQENNNLARRVQRGGVGKKAKAQKASAQLKLTSTTQHTAVAHTVCNRNRGKSSVVEGAHVWQGFGCPTCVG